MSSWLAIYRAKMTPQQNALANASLSTDEHIQAASRAEIPQRPVLNSQNLWASEVVVSNAFFSDNSCNNSKSHHEPAFLTYLVATVDSGGLGGASEQLHLSQPAASRQIDVLEAELGVPLFQRVGRRLRLTSEGEDLLPHSRRLLADADVLAERAHALKRGQAGTLRVAASPQLISSFFARFLPRYRDRHPGIDVRLIEGGRAQLHRYLDRGEIHLATMATADSRFARRLLGPVHLLAVLPKKHRLGRRATIEIAELAEEPLLLMQRGYGAREAFDAACQTANVAPHVLMEGTVGGTLLDLAAEGHGVAVINSTALIRNPELRAVTLANRGVSVGQWMMVCWDPRRLMPPYGQQFIDEVASYARRSFPGREFNRRAPLPARPKLAQY